MAEHILLVDDNDDFRSAEDEFLADQGYRVTTAANGEEALRAVAEETPDIIIMDVAMPHMNGWEALEVLQTDEDTAQIPVIMLTALRGSDSVKKSFNRGSTWFYAKPVTDYHDLLLVIRRILEQQDQPE